MGISFKRAMGLAAMVALMLLETGAQASDCAVVYTLQADLDPDEGTLRGSMEAVVRCDGPLPSQMVLWLYPNRLGEPPEMLDAMNTWWIYPHHFQPGSMSVEQVRVHGQKVEFSEVELPEDHPLSGVEDVAISVPVLGFAGSVATVTMDFTVRVPPRYGLFGRARKGILLGSYWHPVVAGADLLAPPDKATYDITLTLPGGYEGFVGTHRFGPTAQESRTLTLETGPTALVPVAAYPRLETTKAYCDDVKLAFHGLDPRPEWADFEPGAGGVLGINETIPDIMDFDRPWHALEVTCRAVKLLEQRTGPLPAGTHVDLLEAPLRLELASATAGPVVVSDRIFDILPARKAWKFHEFQLVRAVIVQLVSRGMPPGTSPAQITTTADFVASSLVGAYAERWHGAQEDMRDILRYGAFLAAIDYFIYSPLVQFRESYFRTVAEKDWLRDEPWAFLNLLPRGKLTHDKLVDLIGEDAVREVVDGFLAGEGQIEKLAAQAAGEDLQWFFEQWSTAYPSLNYRVAGVESTKLAKGKWRHEARIERQGDTFVREPVTVRFVLGKHEHVDRVWDAPGATTTITIAAETKLDRIVVDPDYRLFEDAALTDNNPRYDNYSEPYWRPPVFTTLAFTSNLTNLTGDIDIVFDMRPKFDLHNSIRFRLMLTTWGQGGTVWYTRGFGPKLDLNSASWHLGVSLSGFHHNDPFGFRLQLDDGTSEHHGGTSITAGVYISHDDRFYMFNPTDGWSWWLRAAYSLGIDDDVPGVGRSLRHAVNVATRGFGLWTPQNGHTFALYGGFGGSFGDPYRGQLASLSSFEVLRGFEVDETFGRLRLYVCAEYRHVFTQGMNLNVLHYATVQGIQGVLFAGAGTVTDESSYKGLFSTDRIFTEVGYGLRFILGYFGSYPGILAVDLAVPITPLHRPGRLPVSVRIAFNHVF